MPAPSRTVRLDPLRVEALPRSDHHLYATNVRYAIRAALLRDPSLSNKLRLVDMNLWLDSSGVVQRFEFVTEPSDLRLNESPVSLVHTVVIQQAPPLDLPQPVHVEIYPHAIR